MKKGKCNSSMEMQGWSTYGTDVASAQILLNGLRIIKTALTDQLDDREVFVRFLVRQVIFLLSEAFRQGVGHIQRPNQWLTGVFPPEASDRGVKLFTLLHLVPRWQCVELELHSSPSSQRA